MLGQVLSDEKRKYLAPALKWLPATCSGVICASGPVSVTGDAFDPLDDYTNGSIFNN